MKNFINFARIRNIVFSWISDQEKAGFSAASVYFRRDIQFHIKSSSVTIMDGDMISSLIMILWHSVRQDIASYIVSKHNKVKSITISKALSTFNMVPWFVPPFEILDVSSETFQFICHPLTFSPVHLSKKSAFSDLRQTLITFFAWKHSWREKLDKCCILFKG